MAIPRRGLRHIRTSLDLVSPQRKFFRLAVLSADRVRHIKERKNARLRVADIDERVAEIETETTRLMKLVVLSESDKPDDTPTIQEKPVPRRTTTGFKLRY